MNCPKCNSEMKAVKDNGIEVDQCINCGGIWLDLGELEEIILAKNAKAFDTGDIKTGREFNKVEDINCPKCNSKMTKMVDLNQPHIWYEKCVNHGIFLDAGELKDISNKDLLSYIKDIKVMVDGGRSSI